MSLIGNKNYDIQNIYFNEKNFEEEISLISKNNKFKYLCINEKGKLSEVNIFKYCFEKIKVLVLCILSVPCIDSTDPTLIRYRILQTISQGLEIKWIAADQISLISSLAKRAGMGLPSVKEPSPLNMRIQNIFKEISENRIDINTLTSSLKEITNEYAIAHSDNLGLTPTSTKISSVILTFSDTSPTSPPKNEPKSQIISPTRKFQICKEAAEQGDIEAMLNTARCYESGNGIEQNDQKAIQWYKLAAEKGCRGALDKLFRFYWKELRIKDPKKALEACQKAADGGDAVAMYNLAYFYYEYRGPEYYQKAAEWFQKAAIKENIFAMFQLGYLYDWGIGIEQDRNNAFKWYQQAANKGYVPAMIEMAKMYQKGSVVAEDNDKVVEWLQNAAQKGNVQSMYDLAFWNEGKENPDLQAAGKWYQKAADRDHLLAMYHLGYLYQTGSGVKKDLNKAFKLLQKAADRGHPGALDSLAAMYENGLGVEKDLGKASELHRKASDLRTHNGDTMHV